MPWARESEQAHGYNGKRPSARRQSGRATLDDDPQRADGEQTTLPETNRNREEAGGGGA